MSAIVAFIAVKWLLGYIRTHTFTPFAIYRIVFGVALLWRYARRRHLTVDVSLRPQHYLQASMQGAFFLYWGWYWRPAYDAIPLIGAQLAFAYAFDMLLAWSRRDTYTLGFGPFPVIFSTNLFLWFRPEWFYLQFCMVAVGFSAKELRRFATKAGLQVTNCEIVTREKRPPHFEVISLIGAKP